MSRSTGRSRATTHRLARAVSAATPDIHPSHALPRLARMIEALEPRRLLASYTIDGTGGDDTITIDADTTVGVTVYHVTVNGTTSTLGPTNPAGNSLTVNCLGGNDNITVPHEGFGDLLNVFGGTGDDNLVVGHGDLGPDIDGTVQLFENAGEGNDSVVINDASGSTSAHNTLHVTASSVYADEAFTFDATVGFDQYAEHVTLNCCPQADEVHVDAPVAGMRINLGDGANTIYYGGSSHTLFGTVYPMTVTAGVNDDTVIFDDSGGGTTGRDYSITPTGIMNQTISGIEHAEVRTRAAGVLSTNTISMSGKPAGMSTLQISGGWTNTSIGGAAAPLDLDSTQVTINSSVLGNTSVWDQDADGILHPFLLWAVGSPKEQQLMKNPNVFRLNMPGSGAAGLSVHGGSTNDVFNIAGVGAGSLVLDGGGGDDALVPFDFAGFNNSKKLDALFTSLVEFDGGPGNDSMQLDDSLDAIGDGDAAYILSPENISKGAAFGGSFHTLVHYSDLERVNFVADADNDSIDFGPWSNVQMTIDGGPGDDFFTNYSEADRALDVYGGPTTLTGNLGNDSLNVVDRVNQNVTEYDVDPSGLSFRVAGGPVRQGVAYDSSLESFTLDENDAGALSQIRGKPAALKLTVNAWAGDDTVQIGGGDLDSSGLSSATTTLGGGAGNDLIVFDDHLDEHNTVNADTFTFTQQTAIKDGTVFVYAGFDSQKLITSGVYNPAVGTAYMVRLLGIGIPTEVEGGAGSRSDYVDVGDASVGGQGLSQIFAPVTLDFLSAPVTVAVNDFTNTTGHVFNFSATQMSSPVTVNYAGVEDLYVYAGTGNDTLNATGTPAGMNVTFNGGSGDEIMNVGSASTPFANLAGRVFAAGGDGTDRVFFTNGTGGGFTDGTLTNGGFKANGGVFQLYQAEAVTVNVNDQGSNINVTSLSASAGIQGGAGSDTVTVGAGDLDVNILASIFVQGGGGFDRIIADDHNGTNQPGTPATYTFDDFVGTGGPVDRFYGVNAIGSFFIASQGVEQRQFDASNDANSITVVDSGGDVRINSNGGNDTINVTDATGVVTVDTGAGDDLLTINTDSSTAGDPPVTVAVDHSDDLNYLDLRPGGTLRVAQGAVLLKTANAGSALSLAGILDLAGGAVVFRPSANVPTQATFRSKLITGRNGGAWNGAAAGAINSSLAASPPPGDGVGYGLGSELGMTAIGPYTVNPADAVLRYTYEGDANLDHRVDLTDFTILAANFNGTGKTWSRADFNYDGLVDLTDFTMLASQFNKSLPAPARAAATTGESPASAPPAAATTPNSAAQRAPIDRDHLAADL